MKHLLNINYSIKQILNMKAIPFNIQFHVLPPKHFKLHAQRFKAFVHENQICTAYTFTNNHSSHKYSTSNVNLSKTSSYSLSAIIHDNEN